MCKVSRTNLVSGSLMLQFTEKKTTKKLFKKQKIKQNNENFQNLRLGNLKRCYIYLRFAVGILSPPFGVSFHSTARFIKPYRDPVYKIHFFSVRFYEMGDIRTFDDKVPLSFH